MIEEYEGAGVVRSDRRADRWLGLAIVLGVIVVGLGLAGRMWASPADSIAMGASWARPSAHPVAAPNQAQVAAPLGGQPPTAGVSGTEVASVLVVSSTTMSGSTEIRLRHTAGSEELGSDIGLEVDGHATSDIAYVTLSIRAASGALLASTVVPTLGDERPASNGLPRIGVRTLSKHLGFPTDTRRRLAGRDRLAG